MHLLQQVRNFMNRLSSNDNKDWIDVCQYNALHNLSTLIKKAKKECNYVNQKKKSNASSKQSEERKQS